MELIGRNFEIYSWRFSFPRTNSSSCQAPPPLGTIRERVILVSSSQRPKKGRCRGATTCEYLKNCIWHSQYLVFGKMLRTPNSRCCGRAPCRCLGSRYPLLAVLGYWHNREHEQDVTMKHLMLCNQDTTGSTTLSGSLHRSIHLHRDSHQRHVLLTLPTNTREPFKINVRKLFFQFVRAWSPSDC